MNSILYHSRTVFFGVIALLAITIFSCEEYIDPPFALEESKLIISSNFSPDDLVSVRLTASQPIVGRGDVQEIKDANISIYEGESLVETLNYVAGQNGRPGVYRSVEFVPVTGIPYTLRASAPGFTPVTASSSIPTSVDITRLFISDLNVSTSESGYELYNFELSVDYDDPTFAENFYDLRIKQLVYPFHLMTNTGDTIFLDPVFKTVESLADVTEDNTTEGESSYLVADKPNGGIKVNLVSKINPKNELLGDLVVELRTVSRDYYEFQVGVQEERRIYSTYSERNVSPNFSNIGGGYGVFAGYSRVTRMFPLVD